MEFYQGIKEKFSNFLDNLPQDFKYAAKKFDELFAINGIFFEEMGLEYIGPIDGHNLEEIIDTLKIKLPKHISNENEIKNYLLNFTQKSLL